MLEKDKIGQNLKEARKKAGYRTQDDLANDLEGFSRSQIGQYESGTYFPPLDFLSKFFSLTNTTYEEIVLGHEPNSPIPTQSVDTDSHDFSTLVNQLVESNNYAEKAKIGSQLKEIHLKSITELSDERRKRLEVTDEYKDLVQWLKQEFKIKGNLPR